MSEWFSVLAVFWILWAIDGAKPGPRQSFTFVSRIFSTAPWRARSRGARVSFSRLSWPGWWPGAWRMNVEDVPLSLSPEGVSNRPAGSAGRPAERPVVATAWRWEEVREVGVAGGWVFINGGRFCPDTGHVAARELLVLAQLAPAARTQRIQVLMNRWFRPAYLRRRSRVLVGRTRLLVTLNIATWAAFVLLTAYLVGDVAARIPAAWGEFLVTALPWLLLGLMGVHVAGVIIAWRSLRRLRAVRPEKRGAHLLSALLLPPQGLRLRAIAGDGYFPAQHPLAGWVAFGGGEACGQAGFNVLADLHWPIGADQDSPLVRAVTAWFRVELEKKVRVLLADAGIAPDSLLAPPVPDGSASCQYCPRCRDQFGRGPTVCPNGIPLRPLGRPEE